MPPVKNVFLLSIKQDKLRYGSALHASSARVLRCGREEGSARGCGRAVSCQRNGASPSRSTSSSVRWLVQLLVRHKGKGVTLTPAGAGLLAHAQQLLSGAENLAAEALQKATGLRGRFAIGCFPTLAPFFLPGVMDAFRREHAGLDLKFEEATAPELNDQLLQGRVDTAILYSVDVSTQLDFEPLHEYLAARDRGRGTSTCEPQHCEAGRARIRTAHSSGHEAQHGEHHAHFRVASACAR